MTAYTVIVSNIGNVYTGTNLDVASAMYKDYCNASARYEGRAAGESVTLMADDEIFAEHHGEFPVE